MSESHFDVSYLSIDSIQEGVGSSQILPLVFGLSKQGSKVSLITFEKTSPKPTLLSEVRNHGVTWIPQEFGRNGTLGGLQRLNTLRRVIPQSKVLHGRSDIPTTSGVLSFSGAPTLWDVRSLWSDQRNLIGTSGWNALTARAALSLENFSAKHAMAMTTLTAAVMPILERRHRKLPTIREVIPTCVDTFKFMPAQMPSGQITCLLSGTFNNYYDLNQTKLIIEEIRKKIDLKVIWARGGESPRESLGVGEDVVITATHGQMPELVAASHFGMAICKQEHLESLSAAVPTKIAEFLASGRPVLVSQGIGDMDEMFMDDIAGLVIANDAPLDNLVSRIQDILSDRNTPEECRNLAMEHFDMEKAVQTYSSIYLRMLQHV